MNKRSESSMFFYAVCFVAVVVTSIVVGFFVVKARTHLPENLATIQHHEIVMQQKNR